jgi:hypothetical protein
MPTPRGHAQRNGSAALKERIAMLKRTLAFATIIGAIAASSWVYAGDCASCGDAPSCGEAAPCCVRPAPAPKTLTGYELRCIRQTSFIENACGPMCLPKYVHCCPTCDTCHTAPPHTRHVGKDCCWYGNLFGLPPKVHYHAKK